MENSVENQLVKSRQRVVDHGEVFTPAWLVEDMLQLVQVESERLESRFLEPACGSGNFLIQVLKKKLRVASDRYKKSEFEHHRYALLALMSIYGIELLEDNVQECRQNLLEIFSSDLKVQADSLISRAAVNVISANIVHGDALTMLTALGEPIMFAEWGYLGKGKYQRRDFHFHVMSQMSKLTEEGTLFANLGRHEIFTPVKQYPVMTLEELAQ